MHSNTHDGYQVLHIAKSNKHVVLDYTHTRSHLTVRATEVANAVRTQRMGRAVFVKQRDGTWMADVVEVNLPFRRMGVATLMYDFAQQRLDGLVVRSNDTNADSQAFWANRPTHTRLQRVSKRMQAFMAQWRGRWRKP
jgi:hypothetical protein